MPLCPKCKTTWTGDEDLRPCNCPDAGELEREIARQRKCVAQAKGELADAELALEEAIEVLEDELAELDRLEAARDRD